MQALRLCIYNELSINPTLKGFGAVLSGCYGWC